MRPCGVIVAPEIVRLSGHNISSANVVDLICQCQNQIADPVDPSDQHLIDTEQPPDFEVAAITVMQLKLLRLQSIDEFLSWRVTDQSEKSPAFELITQFCAGHI
jgi:hypothetical protein